MPDDGRLARTGGGHGPSVASTRLSICGHEEGVLRSVGGRLEDRELRGERRPLQPPRISLESSSGIPDSNRRPSAWERLGDDFSSSRISNHANLPSRGVPTCRVMTGPGGSRGGSEIGRFLLDFRPSSTEQVLSVGTDSNQSATEPRSCVIGSNHGRATLRTRSGVGGRVGRCRRMFEGAADA